MNSKILNRIVKILLISFVFMAGCEGPSALELINIYECDLCKDDECNLGDKPCGEEYICCKQFVPEKHRFIFNCEYDPLFD
jgi:hypothetical protein